MKHFSPSHDYILTYAKNLESTVCNGIPRSNSANERYSNPDNDARGVWKSSDLSVGPAVEANIYPITTPSGRVVMPPSGYSWRLSEQKFKEYVKDNRIWFGNDGNNVPSIKRFLSELRKQGITPMTFWRYEEVGHSQDATQKLAKLFNGKKYFDYPKPVELLKRCVALYGDSDTIILDFFSGSATTAHAVMQLNAEDGSNRKFIMVQLPEETAEDSEAYKAGYKNICEIGKERIRRAGKKIKDELQAKGNLFSPSGETEGGHPLDIGFRVLKCDESNYKPVAFAPKDYTQESLDMFLDNIKEERTGLDLLFDCMMRWGLELSLPYETQKVDGCTIYNVDDGSLVACFDGVVTSAVIDAIADTHPLRVVFRDSSFTEAAQKMNLFELFKQKCGWTDQEVQNNVRVI
jgi:adenine-specific DNA-methyltransferase